MLALKWLAWKLGLYVPKPEPTDDWIASAQTVYVLGYTFVRMTDADRKRYFSPYRDSFICWLLEKRLALIYEPRSDTLYEHGIDALTWTTWKRVETRHRP
jgi:hypothetical protein